MEQPLYRNELDPNNPLNGDAGSFSPEKSKLAGHIVLHESPHVGEISLGQGSKNEVQNAVRPVHLPKAAVGEVADIPMPAARPIEMSAWHNTNLGADEYGQAFHRERAKEQIADPLADAAQQIPTAAQIQQTAAQTQATVDTAMPDANAYYTPPATTMPSNPLYGVMPQNQPLGNAADVAQPLPEANKYQQPTAISGAINPSMPSPMPQEPRLPAGQPIHVDPQHLLPAHRTAFKRVLQNPVVWLAIGIAMIIYFASSLF